MGFRRRLAQTHVCQRPNQEAPSHEIPLRIAGAHLSQLLLAKLRLRPEFKMASGQLPGLRRKTFSLAKLRGRLAETEMEAREPDGGGKYQGHKTRENPFSSRHSTSLVLCSKAAGQ